MQNTGERRPPVSTKALASYFRLSLESAEQNSTDKREDGTYRQHIEPQGQVQFKCSLSRY
jgi:hypothetical protein